MFARCVLGMEDGYERMSLSITPRNDAGHIYIYTVKYVKHNTSMSTNIKREVGIFSSMPCPGGDNMLPPCETNGEKKAHSLQHPTARFEHLLHSAPNHASIVVTTWFDNNFPAMLILRRHK